MSYDQDSYPRTQRLVNDSVWIDPHRKGSSLCTRRRTETRIAVEERRYPLKLVKKSPRDPRARMSRVEPKRTFEILLGLRMKGEGHSV